MRALAKDGEAVKPVSLAVVAPLKPACLELPLAPDQCVESFNKHLGPCCGNTQIEKSRCDSCIMSSFVFVAAILSQAGVCADRHRFGTARPGPLSCNNTLTGLYLHGADRSLTGAQPIGDVPC